LAACCQIVPCAGFDPVAVLHDSPLTGSLFDALARLPHIKSVIRNRVEIMLAINDGQLVAYG
jgi:hypothetical protein